MKGSLAAVTFALFASFVMAGRSAAQDIALTFDDLPSHSAIPAGQTRLGIVARLVAALADAGVPPSVGFINGAQVEQDPSLRSVLEVWRAAGHPVGNHAWSHANLDAVGSDAFIKEIADNEPLLTDLAGDTDWRWFRYPFLAEGRDPVSRRAIRDVLRQRGYKVASVTLDFSDWAWNEPYARCRDKGDVAAIRWMEDRYLAAADQSLTASRSDAQRLLGHDIPYVLLLHAGAFDAHMMPRLLALYRDRGAHFVTLEVAMAHPFYAPDSEARSTPAPLTLGNALATAGQSASPGPVVPVELANLCR